MPTDVVGPMVTLEMIMMHLHACEELTASSADKYQLRMIMLRWVIVNGINSK